jgi:betaine-aldehyde dehydrogenase
VAASLINTGQDCTAATRAYVQRPLFEAFVSRVAHLFPRVRLGDPMDPATDLGPLVSMRQCDRVAGFVQRARDAGAQVLTGGKRSGAYYEPTLVIRAEQSSEIVQSEVFGPVLVALPFDTDDEALANDTRHGLAASASTMEFRAISSAPASFPSRPPPTRSTGSPPKWCCINGLAAKPTSSIAPR